MRDVNAWAAECLLHAGGEEVLAAKALCEHLRAVGGNEHLLRILLPLLVLIAAHEKNEG